jgi:hypothetical protein
MTNDDSEESEAVSGDLFSRSVDEYEPSRRDQSENTGIGSEGTPDPSSGVGDTYRQRLGLSRLQWMLLVSLALSLPYPALFYLFFTAQLTSLPLLGLTLLYSVVVVYVNYRL